MRNFFPGRNNYQVIPAMMMKTAHLELDTLRGHLPEGIFYMTHYFLPVVAG